MKSFAGFGRGILSDNRKSKIQKRPRRLKWVGLLLLLVGWAGVAAAQPARENPADWFAFSRPSFSNAA